MAQGHPRCSGQLLGAGRPGPLGHMAGLCWVTQTQLQGQSLCSLRSCFSATRKAGYLWMVPEATWSPALGSLSRVGLAGVSAFWFACLRALICLGWWCQAAVSASLSLPSHLSCESLGRRLRGSSVRYLRGEVSVPSQDSARAAWLSLEGHLWVQRAEGTVKSLGATVASRLQGLPARCLHGRRPAAPSFPGLFSKQFA